MAARIFDSANEALGHALPERRIYIRSNSGTRYWRATPIAQCGLACILTTCLAWGSLTTYAFVSRAVDGRTAESQLAAAQDAYETKLAALRDQQRLLEQELNLSNARSDAVTRKLSEKQRLLIEMATRYQAAKTELDGLRAEFAAISRKRDAAMSKIAALKQSRDALHLELARATRHDKAIDRTLASFSDSIEDVISARDSARHQVDELDARVADLTQQIDGWRTRQNTLLARIEDATQTSIDELDSVFINADLDIERILALTGRNYTGQGGVFHPAGEVGTGSGATTGALAPDPKREMRVASLMNDLERINLMRIAIKRLPFGRPTVGARLTSDFGGRDDPFRGSKAFHEGVDLAAPRGTPIYATAEGVVVFSGRQSGYGNVIKIRHAFGFETVYAHLSKRRVRVGERVERGARIADMGSTGRSTGNHVHYEVRIDGEPVDPKKFMGAARNVL